MAHRPDCRACKGTGTTTFGQECICNPRDCWHGSLARSCELCERDDEIARLTGFARGILGADADLSEIDETTGRQVAEQWQVDWDRAGQLEADNARLAAERDRLRQWQREASDVMDTIRCDDWACCPHVRNEINRLVPDAEAEGKGE